jgi:hypothetical protein
LGLFLIGVKRDRLPILKPLFLFSAVTFNLLLKRGAGNQSVTTSKKHKIFYEGITGSVTIISRLIASEFLIRIDYKKYAKGHQNPLASITYWICFLFIRFTLVLFHLFSCKKNAALVNLAQHAFCYYPANVRLVK